MRIAFMGSGGLGGYFARVCATEMQTFISPPGMHLGPCVLRTCESKAPNPSTFPCERDGVRECPVKLHFIEPQTSCEDICHLESHSPLVQ